jgi:hypothetical protein
MQLLVRPLPANSLDGTEALCHGRDLTSFGFTVGEIARFVNIEIFTLLLEFTTSFSVFALFILYEDVSLMHDSQLSDLFLDLTSSSTPGTIPSLIASLSPLF